MPVLAPVKGTTQNTAEIKENKVQLECAVAEAEIVNLGKRKEAVDQGTMTEQIKMEVIREMQEDKSTMTEDHFEAGSKNCDKAMADCGVMTE